MRITYLKEFIEVGLTLNLSKTACKLHVSQPSLSKHIAALERECGTALLKRGASSIQLTKAGQVLLEEAFTLVRMHDEAVKRVRNVRETQSIRISGLFDNSTSIELINRTLAEMNKDEDRVGVSYQDFRHLSLDEQLAKGKVDIVFTILVDPGEMGDGFCAEHLFDDPMICLAKEGHPFFGRDSISIRELNGKTILQPVGSFSAEHGRSTVQDFFRRYEISPTQRPVFVHSISELSTVANQENILIMQRSMLTTQPFTADYHIVAIDEPDVSFSFYVVWMPDPEKPLLQEFISQLTKHGKLVSALRPA